jgi:spermidine synthase
LNPLQGAEGFFMQFKRLLSFIWDIPIEKTSSKHNPYLEVVWSYGRKMLNTETANYSFGNGYKVFQRAFKEVEQEINKAKDVLILGFGCGSILHLLEKKYNVKPDIVGIEYDAQVLELFDSHFADNYSLQPELLAMDAEEYMNTCTRRFDIIFIDLFQELNNAPVVTKPQFIEQLAKAASNGTLVFNLTEQNKQDKAAIQELILQLSRYYKDVKRVPFQEYNQIVIAK